MFDRADVNYLYDGTFAGFLSCVFESYAKKEEPFAISRESSSELAFFERRVISTDKEKARRVARSIPQKMGDAAWDIMLHAFMSCLPGKELHLLRFICLGYEKGPAVLNMLADERVHILCKAVRALNKETENYRGFLRFSLHKGVMLSAISPQNFVLPALGAHFQGRFPNEQFLIYDRTHKEVFVCSKGRHRIFTAESFELPQAEEGELSYRALWRIFYNTIAIRERENPRCRMSHLPKHYWAEMTEFQTDAPIKNQKPSVLKLIFDAVEEPSQRQ